jgi:hypothetical protein
MHPNEVLKKSPFFAIGDFLIFMREMQQTLGRGTAYQRLPPPE